MYRHVTSRLLLLLLSALLIAGPARAQQRGEGKGPKKSFGERIFVGGALGFSLGTYSSLIDVSPIVGYSLTDDLVVGIGLTYKYFRYKDYYEEVDSLGGRTGLYHDFRTNMYGGSIWMRYFLTKTEIPIIENIFLHAEVEPLLFVNKYKMSPAGEYRDIYGYRYVQENDRVNVTGYFLGGGLSQPIGGRSYMYIELLWNFNDEMYSPYSNPRIRIGVAAGF